MVSEIARKLDANNVGIHDWMIARIRASIRVAESNVTLHICAGDVALGRDFERSEPLPLFSSAGSARAEYQRTNWQAHP
jgi:hypothetical protein